jgi:hypothetical protein
MKHKYLESTAKKYAICSENSQEINPKGIVKDLHFLSPEAVRSASFSKYMQENSFEVIARYAYTQHQQAIVMIFTQAFQFVKADVLLNAQLCMLLDKVLINLRPSINIDLSAHPALKSFADSPSFKCQKMLLPSLDCGPW